MIEEHKLSVEERRALRRRDRIAAEKVIQDEIERKLVEFLSGRKAPDVIEERKRTQVHSCWNCQNISNGLMEGTHCSLDGGIAGPTMVCEDWIHVHF